MAQVFLSYDRRDLAKARTIALALEKAGHAVWWDRHIKSGAQYSKEIETALNAAEAVVVLWSERSIDSAWVRDEAAAGRDTGRLVPVIIGKAEPPLGFRQYQTTDLSRWNGRANAAHFQSMLGAVNALGTQHQSEPIVLSARREESQSTVVIVLVAVAALAFIAALLAWQPWYSRPDVPIVTVQPADASNGSAGLANDLLVQLGSLQSSNANALQLVDSNAGIRPDLTFKVGGSAAGQEPTASLTLIDSDGGALLWSRDFQPPSGKAADLRQQVAYTAARVLECTTEALSSNLRQQTLKLYLNGCAELHSLWEDDPRSLIDVFTKVTGEAPTFEGGWEKLLLAQLESHQNQNFEIPNARESLRQNVAKARKVNPEMAEAYLAEAWLSSPRPIITWMRLAEKAVERNPNNPIALVERARGYQHVGRMRDAIEDTRRAVQIDSLSPGARDALASALAYAGQIEAGFKVLVEAERLWPGASNLVAARYRFLLRYGDPKQALRILQSGAMTAPATPMQESFLQARINPSPAMIERAINHGQSFYMSEPRGLSNYIQALAEFGRDEQLAETLLRSDPTQAPGIIEVIFRPAFRSLHRDPRFMRIAQRYGLLDYWRESESWPDLCLAADLPYDCKAEAAKLPA